MEPVDSGVAQEYCKGGKNEPHDSYWQDVVQPHWGGDWTRHVKEVTSAPLKDVTNQVMVRQSTPDRAGTATLPHLTTETQGRHRPYTWLWVAILALIFAGVSGCFPVQTTEADHASIPMNTKPLYATGGDGRGRPGPTKSCQGPSYTGGRWTPTALPTLQRSPTKSMSRRSPGEATPCGARRARTHGNTMAGTARATGQCKVHSYVPW